jgi:hypothetical protein
LRDQADAAVSADAVVVPDLRPAAVIPPSFLPDSYRRLDGVEEVVPVDHSSAVLSASLGTVPLVATDARALGDALRLRDDLYGPDRSAGSLAVLHDPADLGAVELGDPTGDLVVPWRLRADPGTAPGTVRLAATLVDGDGTVVRVDAAERIAITDGDGVLTFPLATTTVPGDELVLIGPLRLIELEVSAPAVQDPPPFDDAPPSPAVFDLELFDAEIGDRVVPLVADWTLNSLSGPNVLEPPSVEVEGRAGGVRVRLGTGVTAQTSAVVVADVGTGEFGFGAGNPVPALVTPDLLAAAELSVGDTITARVSGATVDLRIDGTVPVVPFEVAAERAILVDWETLSADRWVRARRLETVDTWALTADADAAARLERVLAGPPWSSASYTERRQTARDIARAPVTVGLSGSLGLALVASLVVAAIGLVLTAVVGARERRPAFAVLRAMGTRASELRRWLLLETVPLVGLSALAGVASGIALARLALPSLAVSSDGTRSVPSPVLVVPWVTLAVVVAIAVAAGMALPVVTARLLRRHRTADELRIGDAT